MTPHQLKSRYVPLWFQLVKKEIRVKYSRTFFGILWVGLLPLVQMAVIGSVLHHFLTIEHYFIYLFSGLLTWQFFSTSLLSMTSSILSNRQLVKKAAFPLILLPLSSLGAHFFQFLLVFCGLIAFALGSGNILLEDLLIWIIPGLVILLFLTTGLGLILSTLHVWRRDVGFLITALFMPWFYATPIVYQLSQLPDPFSRVLMWNPLLTPFSFIQKLAGAHIYLPLEIVFTHSLIAIFAFLLSVLIFNSRAGQFVDEV
jgi:ABC-type polysaccharide/polyol phosphate export permease